MRIWSEAVYPHLSHVASLSRDRTQKLARLGLFVMAGIGTTMGLAIYLSSPRLIPVLLGHGYEPAIRVLQILSLLAPVIAIRNVFAIHWMLPLDLDSHLNMIVVGTGYSTWSWRYCWLRKPALSESHGQEFSHRLLGRSGSSSLCT
jgi:hypothetical protein